VLQAAAAKEMKVFDEYIGSGDDANKLGYDVMITFPHPVPSRAAPFSLTALAMMTDVSTCAMVCDLLPWFAEPRSGTAFCGGGDISWPPLPHCDVHQASAFLPQSTQGPQHGAAVSARGSPPADIARLCGLSTRLGCRPVARNLAMSSRLQSAFSPLFAFSHGVFAASDSTSLWNPRGR
jgi:hypothetical protein